MPLPTRRMSVTMSVTQLSERHEKILLMLKVSPTLTAKQMSVTLSVSKRTIERDLAHLTEMGILKREGKVNDGIWVVTQ